MKNSLEELYQKGKTYRDNGKPKKSKPKFTNMKVVASFKENEDGTYTCDPKSLSTGGYEDFIKAKKKRPRSRF